ncbi:MAG: competence/damage-inducible protein A [Verrucomicrobia bacterium]|jgi:nicotinamide-nucleotide amidase|nr:competence/damage-inducible protein A [Verrucomicrobiota bacterium]
MIVELINTGSELMIGSTLNTHHQWLGQQFALLGSRIERQVSVADTAEAIEQAVRESLGRADVVVVTGGLGPTSDDLTRDRVASLLGCGLREDPLVVERIESFFAARNRPMPASTRIQALVPDGAFVIQNNHGTAPGLAIDVPAGKFRDSGGSVLIMLPGPPRELRPMFRDSVAPLLRTRFAELSAFQCRVLRSTGLGESHVEERVGPLLRELIERGLEVGYCARLGAVDVRLAVRGPEGDALVDEAEGIVRATIGKWIFGVEGEELESVVLRLLKERQGTLSIAESCTGGFVSHRITNVPGASAVFLAGLVTYSNEAKQTFLGVREQTLAEHGAVSQETAREMAEGVRDRSGATYGLSVTGIAGPGGGTAEKPVGTAFVGLAGPKPTVTLRLLNPFDRESFKQATSQQALELLRRGLSGD